MSADFEELNAVDTISYIVTYLWVVDVGASVSRVIWCQPVDDRMNLGQATIWFHCGTRFHNVRHRLKLTSWT